MPYRVIRLSRRSRIGGRPWARGGGRRRRLGRRRRPSGRPGGSDMRRAWAESTSATLSKVDDDGEGNFYETAHLANRPCSLNRQSNS